MRRTDAGHGGPSRQQGFSYLWVLLIVAFLGVGLTVAVEVEVTASQRDREKELLAIGRQFRFALSRYYETQMAGGRHAYPASLDELLADSRVPGIRRHLRKVFVDPMTGKAEWGLVKVGGRIVGVFSLSDKTPIKQDGFEADDSSFKGKDKYSDWKFVYPANLLLRPDNPALSANANAPVGTLFPAEDVKGRPGEAGASAEPSETNVAVPYPDVPAPQMETPER